MFALAIIAGGMTFNIATIALPKVVDERVGDGLPLAVIGSVAHPRLPVRALTQVLMGRLIDRYSLPVLFLGLSVLQPLGLGIAALSTGVPLLLGLVPDHDRPLRQVVINDAMVARYVPPAYRARAYSVRYFLGFTVSGFVVPNDRPPARPGRCSGPCSGSRRRSRRHLRRGARLLRAHPRDASRTGMNAAPVAAE